METNDSCFLSGDSPAMCRVRSQLERIAPYVRTALITGEKGTGKEHVARALHARGPGAAGPFVMRDATQFAKEIIGPGQSDARCMEAQGGTLFLTRIGRVPLAQQAALLWMLQQQGMRTGRESRGVRGDLRIVVSSDRDLRPLVTMGQIRSDLHRRFAAVEIALTPLRKRPEDIVGVAGTMLRRVGGRGISAEALARLEHHRWPGNVRELQEVVERAVSLAGNAVLEARHLFLPEHFEEPHLDRLQDVVRRHVLEVLTRCSGNKLRASEMLGISRSMLYRMLDVCVNGDDPGYTGQD
jgi:DNA-binding NtrC family response regulator